MLGSNKGLNLRFEAIRLTEIIRMNNIVIYCTVMLGYLEYKIQLGKERKNKTTTTTTTTKNREGYLTKCLG